MFGIEFTRGLKALLQATVVIGWLAFGVGATGCAGGQEGDSCEEDDECSKGLSCQMQEQTTGCDGTIGCWCEEYGNYKICTQPCSSDSDCEGSCNASDSCGGEPNLCTMW